MHTTMWASRPSLRMRVALILLGWMLGAGSAAWAARPTVAVFPFRVGDTSQVHVQVQGSDDDGSLTIKRSRQSNLITNLLVNALVHSGKTAVVERQKVRKIRNEARFSQSDLVDPGHAEKLGKMLGADYLVFGAITSLEPRVEVEQLPYNAGVEKKAIMEVGANARMVDTETGRVVASTRKFVKKVKSGTRTNDSTRLLTRQFEEEALNQLAREMATDLLSQRQ